MSFSLRQRFRVRTLSWDHQPLTTEVVQSLTALARLLGYSREYLRQEISRGGGLTLKSRVRNGVLLHFEIERLDTLRSARERS